jgi:hypothetical protein
MNKVWIVTGSSGMYEDALKVLKTDDDTTWVFDYLANDFSTVRVVAAHIELEHAEQEAKELKLKEINREPSSD